MTRLPRLLTPITFAALGVAFVPAAFAVNDAQFVMQTVPTVMVPGQVYSVSVTLLNTGNTSWDPATLYRLGAQNPQDNATWGDARMKLPGPVTPGTIVTIRFDVTAPSDVGTYNFQWRMLQEAVGWFGDLTPNVSVKDGNNDSAFVSQNVPASMSPGQKYGVSVTMQNTGRTTWTAAGLYHLGSQSPQDNSAWGIQRVELPNDVPPGANVTFSFNVTAPANISPYNFQWRMVQDNVEWFGAYTDNVSIKDGIN